MLLCVFTVLPLYNSVLLTVKYICNLLIAGLKRARRILKMIQKFLQYLSPRHLAAVHLSAHLKLSAHLLLSARRHKCITGTDGAGIWFP